MSLIPLPYRILGGLVVLLAAFSGGLWLGSDYAKAKCVAGQSQAQATAVVEADSETTRREGVAATRETEAEQIRIVYRTIKEQAHENITDHPELNACGLDADGLRIWNAANRGAAPGVRSEPYLEVHRAATGEVGRAAGSADQSYRGDGDVQPVPGQAGETGGVRK